MSNLGDFVFSFMLTSPWCLFSKQRMSQISNKYICICQNITLHCYESLYSHTKRQKSCKFSLLRICSYKICGFSLVQSCVGVFAKIQDSIDVKCEISSLQQMVSCPATMVIYFTLVPWCPNGNQCKLIIIKLWKAWNVVPCIIIYKSPIIKDKWHNFI